MEENRARRRMEGLTEATLRRLMEQCGLNQQINGVRSDTRALTDPLHRHRLYQDIEETRARSKMEIHLGESLLRLLMENCGINLTRVNTHNRSEMIEMILRWRIEEGDFDITYDDESNPRFLDDVVNVGNLNNYQLLPLYQVEVPNEDTIACQFTKCDLQLECLSREIPYEASDTKHDLISRLIHYHTSLFQDSNRFNHHPRSLRNQNKAHMIEVLIGWRRSRGDFREDNVEDDIRLDDLNDIQSLKFYLQDTDSLMLNDKFTKCDLQLECLVRNIAYEASDYKHALIEKLMHFKSNFFEDFHVDDNQDLEDSDEEN